jgi:hypothetical protein
VREFLESADNPERRDQRVYYELIPEYSDNRGA